MVTPNSMHVHFVVQTGKKCFW